MRPPVFELVRQGLSSAVLGLPAGSVKNAKNGLFPNNQNGRDAASFISEMGLMDGNVGEEGATHQVTSQGFQWLREQGAPVINDFLRHLEQWKDQDRALVSKVKEDDASFCIFILNSGRPGKTFLTYKQFGNLKTIHSLP